MEPPWEVTVPLARRSLMDAAAARFGWRRAYGDTTKVDALLTQQSEAAYTAAGHALATAKNTDAVQPGVLDARGPILADVLYLKGVLAGARNRGTARAASQPRLAGRRAHPIDGDDSESAACALEEAAGFVTDSPGTRLHLATRTLHPQGERV
ncbi:hypothetical protein ACH4PU_32195 [Streptomyces sp. NPDC021100]|uniref:hypothetical protein n=1 Tax=Streptomyces sp. NPDC021100 TaxID=3365114 RepID=UPI0037B94A57